MKERRVTQNTPSANETIIQHINYRVTESSKSRKMNKRAICINHQSTALTSFI